MQISRRAILAASAVPSFLADPSRAAPQIQPSPVAPALPVRSAFAATPYAYLDCASTHPMPLAARDELETYLRFKTLEKRPLGYDMHAKQARVIETFGALVGASPDELSITQSTTLGENLVLRALGLPQAGGRIVTDALHFTGSYYTYVEMARAGVDVVTLPMGADGKTSMTALEAAINERTRLVAISAVSSTNGFQHDLKRVCDAAHAHGAMVYVDLIQAAGAVPVDLRASGVDFAACATYKWLMGDFGLAFLYARREVQQRISRPWWGREQLSSFTPHVLPYDPPGAGVADYGVKRTAEGLFAMGTTSWTGVVQLDHSLPWIQAIDPGRLQAWRQPMIDTLQTELRGRGYQVLTPQDSRTQIVAIALKNAPARVNARLERAGVRATVLDNRVRIAVASFNDINDIDRVLTALPAGGV